MSNSQNREILFRQNFIYASKTFLPEFSLSQRGNAHFSLSFPGSHLNHEIGEFEKQKETNLSRIHYG